jgi:hypothetical protein
MGNLYRGPKCRVGCMGIEYDRQDYHVYRERRIAVIYYTNYVGQRLHLRAWHLLSLT